MKEKDVNCDEADVRGCPRLWRITEGRRGRQNHSGSSRACGSPWVSGAPGSLQVVGMGNRHFARWCHLGGNQHRVPCDGGRRNEKGARESLLLLPGELKGARVRTGSVGVSHSGMTRLVNGSGQRTGQAGPRAAVSRGGRARAFSLKKLGRSPPDLLELLRKSDFPPSLQNQVSILL